MSHTRNYRANWLLCLTGLETGKKTGH